MEPPTEAVQAELRTLLQADQTRLGGVYRLLERGRNANAIADELGVDSSGFVANKRAVVRALLEGHLPNGESISGQVGSAVRGLTRRARLSPDTQAYVNRLLDSLDGQAVRTAPWEPGRVRIDPVDRPGRDAGSRGNLREQVDREVRARSAALIALVKEVTGIEAIDYNRIMGAGYALDTVSHLIVPNAACESTLALLKRDRRDLTLENAVLEWASDLPISHDLVAAAKARLDWWRND